MYMNDFINEKANVKLATTVIDLRDGNFKFESAFDIL